MPDPKPDSKTIRTLQGVARALSRLSRERARAAGADLTPQQAESLQLLAERGVTSTSTLALMLGIDPSTASRNLAGLERRGYIVRRRGTEDGRQTDVRLTARGKRTAEAVSSGWSEVMASLLERFPRAERPRIADALDTLARVLDGGGDR
jgi:DNA-binding MarR family transcriptional regulator